MSTPGIDRRLVSEDCIESCILLLRHHLTKNVTPMMANTGHLPMLDHSKHSPPKQTTTPTPKKRRRSSGAAVEQGILKELKNVYKLITASIPLLIQLFEAMEKLVYAVQMDDQPLLTLSSAAMSVFGIDPYQGNDECHMLHVTSIGLVTAISRRHPKHRTILMEDLFPVLLQLPTSKKSQRTFPVPSPPPFSPLLKRASGYEVDQQPCIQAMSVLIVSLIQSCVNFPSFEEHVHNVEKNAPTVPESSRGLASTKLKSGLTNCQRLCDQLVAQILQRCSRKGEDGGASEFRPILSNLVDDFLVMQLLPEHPAAEMLLLTLSRGLANDIFKASSSAKTSSTSRNPASTLEFTYLSTAFDILGKISASVAGILASQRERPLSIARQIQENQKSKSEGRNVNSCFCGRYTFTDTLMVCCDTCRGFFHGECVGENKSTLVAAGRQKQWQCDDCKLKSMALEQTKSLVSRRALRAKAPDAVPPIIETHVFRQLVLTHLSDNTDSTPGFQFAREFLLATWVKDLCADDGDDSGVEPVALAQQFLDLWERPHANLLTSKHAGTASLLNEDGYHRLMITLAATKSDLVASFPRQIGLLIQFMADEAFVSIRKLAVKALSQVVDADSKLMLHPALKNAVSARFADEAKSVREAVVGLVGSFVVSCPELANAFHSSFLARLLDDGVSVKKRTVKIFRDILTTNPNYTERAAACALMLKRAADPKEDDSVRDLIHELFIELWLENSEVPSPVKRMALLDVSKEEPVPQAQSTHIAGRSIVTPIASPDKPSHRKLESNVDIRCRLASEQMVDVVLAADSNDMLTALLKDLLSGFSDADRDRKASDRKKRKRSSSSHCGCLVDALVEHLLTLEENRGKDVECFGRKLVATIRTIGAIAQIAPNEVRRHVDTLLPYLKADNGIPTFQECNVVSEVCDIIYRGCRVMSKGEIKQLTKDSIGGDLVGVTYRLGSSALASAVRTLCELGSHPGLSENNPFRQQAAKLATTFYGYLHKSVILIEDFSKADKRTKCNIQRALSVLGCICKSHAVENEDTTWMDEGPENTLTVPEDVTWQTMAEACYKIFVTYLATSDVETKCTSMKALGGIFISRPRVLLAMQQSGAIEAIMAPGSEPELQLYALRCWREILLAEENRIESGDAKAKMESNQNITVSNKISGDQDSDATLVGGVLTCHSQRLHDMTKDRNERIRYACVDLLSHLLRQGLLNPFQTIPFLFGLQGDVAAPDIRALALKLLISEGEKRPDMLRQRICAGVKNAFSFQRVVYPDRETTAAIAKTEEGTTTYECIFSSVFKECIRNTKKQKQGLFTNLLGLFDTGERDESAKKMKKRDFVGLPLLSFTAEMLAYLPYNTANDPLFIIYHIQSLAALHGAQHLDNIVAFLQEQGFPVDVNDDNNEEDNLEIAAKAKRPSRTKHALLLSKRSFDILRFETLCETASSFILLLRLKAYLRKVYNLSETRCLVYSPEVMERNFDKIASSVSNMPLFDSKIPGFFRHEGDEMDGPNERDVDRDTVIMQYAEFRRLLRTEQTAGSRIAEMDDDDDEKETTSNGAELREDED